MSKGSGSGVSRSDRWRNARSPTVLATEVTVTLARTYFGRESLGRYRLS